VSFWHRRVSDDTQRAPHGNPPAKKYRATHNRFDTTVLAAQAGEKKLREVVTSGGFTWFRRAAETPFNLILKARS